MSESGLSETFEKAVREGLIGKMLEEYIFRCAGECSAEAEQEKKKNKKTGGKFPNVAGFCRHFGIGKREFDRLRVKYPDEFEHILAVFEDEALNSGISPTILSAYLKKRLCYDNSGEGQEAEGLSITFEHDVLRDGE